MDGRIDVIKGKLVGGDLPIWCHVPLAQKQDQLLFSKFWVNFGKGDHMEGQVPRGVLERGGRERERERVDRYKTIVLKLIQTWEIIGDEVEPCY